MASSDRSSSTARSSATPKSASSAPSKFTLYRVRPGHTVTGAEMVEGESIPRVYQPGEMVELTEAEAKKMPWAVDTGERRRAGQTSRQRQRITELEAEVARLRGDSSQRQTDRTDAKAQEEIRQSLLNRGDNFIGRGEPDPDRVPPDVLDAHDRLLETENQPDTEELSGGFKGRAPEKATAPKADPNAPPSVPTPANAATDHKQ